ncbi:MAG: hypothetical protein J5864_04985 [Oscillospiraceae bacterium]|nr:hypothetical protein [Oscillospiraceae bacterium]
MKKTYDIKLSLLSAMHINGGVSANNKRLVVKLDGSSYVPATLLKGIIRANFEMLVNTFEPQNIGISASLFGSEGYNRSHVILDNLTSEQNIPLENRAGNAVDRYTRKVLDKALVFSEVTSRFDLEGDPSAFSGEMTVYYNDETKKYEKYLVNAVKMISCVGTGKSRGLGFAEVTVNEKTC